MSSVNVVILVVLTSVAGYLVGTRRCGLARPELGSAVPVLLETIGISAVFMVANLGIAVGTIAMIRASGSFVSVYGIDDIALAGASLLQGSLFRWWWGRR